MAIFNPWFVGSLMLLGIWVVLYFFRKGYRKEMIWASLIAAPLGLTEFLFVPEYWSPPSLFNLAQTIGLDIESIIFSFAAGGVAAVLYEAVIRVRHKKITKEKVKVRGGHKFGLMGIYLALIIFILLEFSTNVSSIYLAMIAMFVGGISTLLCRPDLKKKIWLGGFLFLSVYFFGFLLFNLIYPDFVLSYYNTSELWGVFVLGIPVEEIIFAFSFGVLWSGIYEHVFWYRLQDVG
jgi:hypothetical protein